MEFHVDFRAAFRREFLKESFRESPKTPRESTRESRGQVWPNQGQDVVRPILAPGKDLGTFLGAKSLIFRAPSVPTCPRQWGGAENRILARAKAKKIYSRRNIIIP